MRDIAMVIHILREKYNIIFGVAKVGTAFGARDVTLADSLLPPFYS